MADKIATQITSNNLLQNYRKFNDHYYYPQTNKAVTLEQLKYRYNFNDILNYSDKQLVPLNKITVSNYPVPLPATLHVYIDASSYPNYFPLNTLTSLEKNIQNAASLYNTNDIRTVNLFDLSLTRCFWENNNTPIRNIGFDMTTMDGIIGFLKKTCNFQNYDFQLKVSNPMLDNNSQDFTNNKPFNNARILQISYFSSEGGRFNNFNNFNTFVNYSELTNYFFSLQIMGDSTYNTDDSAFSNVYGVEEFYDFNNNNTPIYRNKQDYYWGTRFLNTSQPPIIGDMTINNQTYTNKKWFKTYYQLKSFSLNIDIRSTFNSNVNNMGRIVIHFFNTSYEPNQQL